MFGKNKVVELSNTQKAKAKAVELGTVAAETAGYTTAVMVGIMGAGLLLKGIGTVIDAVPRVATDVGVAVGSSAKRASSAIGNATAKVKAKLSKEQAEPEVNAEAIAA